MAQCMVNLGKDNKAVHLWDKVVIFGPKESGTDTSADALAKIGNTISYEVLTSLSKRVKRFSSRCLFFLFSCATAWRGLATASERGGWLIDSVMLNFISSLQCI